MIFFKKIQKQEKLPTAPALFVIENGRIYLRLSNDIFNKPSQFWRSPFEGLSLQNPDAYWMILE